MARRIPIGQVALFRHELANGTPKRKKIALQEICALYRQDHVLSAEQATSIETTINGIVLQEGQDEKVVRWCLNAIAQFGRLSNCLTYVEAALTKYAADPEIQAAGVAALCKMYRGSVGDIEALSRIDPIVWKLAALQNTDPAKIDLRGLSIDIYNASPAILRLALITVGLNKDIENLFHPRHTNAAFVRHLCNHDDNIVQQYSVWSVIENRRLGFKDLGIPVDNIERLPVNVQAKMYQLVAERDTDMSRRREITFRGSLHAPDEAREGLAKGVKRNYYEGLENVTIEWLRQERHKPVREILAEHVGTFARDCPPYEELALELYDSDPSLRDRLLLGAEGTQLYGQLRAISPGDLFEGFDDQDVGRLLQDRSKTATLTKLKILMLMASPLDNERVRFDEEYRDIEEQVNAIRAPKVKLHFDLKIAVRHTDLLTHLLNCDAEILHFSGHAWTDALVFEDATGNSKSVDIDSISELLSKTAKTLQCAVLNACFTAKAASTLSAHLKAVIGCDDTIEDEAAVIFSRAFYQSLSSGHTYADSFELAKSNLKVTGHAAEASKYQIVRQ